MWCVQSFSPDPSLAPVSQPVMKLAGPMQTTGEAIYTDDEVSRHCMTMLEWGTDAASTTIHPLSPKAHRNPFRWSL